MQPFKVVSIPRKNKSLLQALTVSQSVKNTYPCIQEFLKALWIDLYRTSLQQGKTSYKLYNFKFTDPILQSMNYQLSTMQDPEFLKRLVELVKEEYEDCLVEYDTTDSTLTIDWTD